MLISWLKVVTVFVTVKAKLTFRKFVSRARSGVFSASRSVSHSICLPRPRLPNSRAPLTCPSGSDAVGPFYLFW
jgi:hypothetical protein